MQDVSKEKVFELMCGVISRYSIECTTTDGEIYSINFAELGFDSLMFVEFIIEIEDYFLITIPVEYLSMNEIPDINTITSIIQKVIRNA